MIKYLYGYQYIWQLWDDFVQIDDAGPDPLYFLPSKKAIRAAKKKQGPLYWYPEIPRFSRLPIDLQIVHVLYLSMVIRCNESERFDLTY